MQPTEPVLVWMDLEMTGLDPENCVILELAMILTDRNLVELAEPLDLAIWQPENALATMTPFVRKMHERTGLLARVRSSEVSIDEAERKALELVTAHASYKNAYLCGNSIWQDRRFLGRHMPALEGYFHYRQVDVSTLKQLADWWYGKKYEKPEDQKHTALRDARLSIEEIRYYRSHILR